MKKYALFIGRWQNWHKGHQWLIDQQFEKGKNVWLAIRDVNRDKDNPKTAKEILDELTEHLKDYLTTGRLYISIIPDIESINYGRGVGYDVIYHEPPTDVAAISGTAIRTGHMTPDGNIKYDETKG
jgi:phosphopantetheine adenylyltransferase